MKNLLLVFSIIMLMSCKNSAKLNGSWVLAYSYEENDTTKDVHFVDKLPAVLDLNENGVEALFQELGGPQAEKQYSAYEVTKENVLLFRNGDENDSLQLLSKSKKEFRVQKPGVVSVYKKLDTQNSPELKSSDIGLGLYSKVDGDWEVQIDFISDEYYIANPDSVPSIHNYKWIDNTFLSLDGFSFWPYNLTRISDEGFTLKRYGRENGEVRFKKINMHVPEFSLNGLWKLTPENSLPIPLDPEGLDTTHLQMTLFFEDNEVSVSQYGKQFEKEFLWNSDKSLIYFHNEISNIFPSWRILERTENTLELEMIPYNSWDTYFKIYKLSFVKE